ncbi:flagellin N-terminal helical domain-containing protein [Limnochorda pilosa]|uniref:Flagellin n=1 Tax=Limnochorda pilosa TaxID=1555112 RepID=A0A0K2SMJ7_LIMPI|nr:flagellin [Limnochorda pilosa]BAS28222.1 flagellin [Limnochorda pilosa]
MRINNNVSALNSWRNLYVNDQGLTKSMEKLSSGFRINRAGDDAAGLAISEKMRSQIRGLNMAAKNAQDGISLIQTAEGALNETHSMLHRIRELAVQSANDTNTDSDRAQLQLEVDALLAEITRIGTDTEFNSKKLLNGSATGLAFQIGANANQYVTLSIGTMTATGLGINAVSIGSGFSAASLPAVLSLVDAAIGSVSSQRAQLGALQNRFEHSVNFLQIASENLTAAESRIRDADIAQEMTGFVKHQILTQASTAMLAQANAKPQTVLQLLG